MPMMLSGMMEEKFELFKTDFSNCVIVPAAIEISPPNKAHKERWRASRGENERARADADDN